MIKKTIKYTDLNGQMIVEDFYFNLSKVELMEIETGTAGGLGEKLLRIANTKDASGLIEQLKELITISIGRKSDDGKRFIKSPTIVEEFVQCPAFEALFMELVLDAGAAADFVNGLPPGDFTETVEKMQAISAQLAQTPLPPPPPAA